jgi:hypothetical protein
MGENLNHADLEKPRRTGLTLIQSGFTHYVLRITYYAPLFRYQPVKYCLIYNQQAVGLKLLKIKKPFQLAGTA